MTRFAGSRCARRGKRLGWSRFRHSGLTDPPIPSTSSTCFTGSHRGCRTRTFPTELHITQLSSKNIFLVRRGTVAPCPGLPLGSSRCRGGRRSCTAAGGCAVIRRGRSQRLVIAGERVHQWQGWCDNGSRRKQSGRRDVRSVLSAHRGTIGWTGRERLERWKRRSDVGSAPSAR